jgi:hypothetical protein
VSAIAIFLIAVGIADLCRRVVDAAWPPLVIGPVLVVGCAASGALWHGGDVALLVPAACAVAAWEWLSMRSERSGRRQAAPLAALVLVQFATANQLVRLVLGSVGAVRPAGEPQPSDRLKGGRLLGPMERLLILSLGAGGQVAAAGAVVAAKGIIRFPELNAQKGRSGEIGIDEVTEYFLLGSFASWLLALGGIALVLTTR